MVVVPATIPQSGTPPWVGKRGCQYHLGELSGAQVPFIVSVCLLDFAESAVIIDNIIIFPSCPFASRLIA